MKALARIVAAAGLLGTAAVAGAELQMPSQADLTGYIKSSLTHTPTNQQSRIMMYVNFIVHEHLANIKDPEQYKAELRQLASPDGQRKLIEELGHQMGSDAAAIDRMVNEAEGKPGNEKTGNATGSAPAGTDATVPGTPGTESITSETALREALLVFNNVHTQITDNLDHQQQEENRLPTNQPNGETHPAASTPPVPADQRIRNNAAAAQVIADQHPENIDAQRRATQISYNTHDFDNGAHYGSHYFGLGGSDPTTLDAAGRSAVAVGDNDFAQAAGQRAAESDPSDKYAQALANLSVGHLGDVDVDGALTKAGAGTLNADQVNKQGDALYAASVMNTGAGTAVSAGGQAGAAGAAGANPQTAAEIAAAAQKAATTPPSKVQQSASLTKEVASALNVRDYQAAYNIASQAIDLNPRNAQAWNDRAIADNKLAQYPNAVYDASFSLGLVPGNAPALQTRSWAFAKQGQYREALADANFTIEKEPSNAFAFQNRAYAQAGMGDRAGALASLRKSAELDERFKDKYQAALQAPENSDLLFLFNDEPAGKAAGAGAPARNNRVMRLFLLSMLGGLIVALGVLNVVSERFREKMRSTMRRVIGSPAPVNDMAQGNGFWGGQYEMLRTLGQGGMGIVYEAEDKSLGRRVAVKKMRDEIRLDSGERQRFVQEARVVASLHHPNIVDIFAIVEDDQDVYLVFEYVPGKTLSDVLKERGTFDLARAGHVLAGACAAVEHAHKNKIIHRDIKPSNIMLGDAGAVKVMDFGVARQAKDAMTRQALTNTIVGTPPYMAPEQEQGTVRKESDVFGLGVVFYEMLTGRLPFQGQGAGMLLNKINGRHVPASGVVPSLPLGLDAVIAKAIAADPEKRYQSPAEFLAAVNVFLTHPA